jgi:HD-like signal output (HDOD) protein
MLLQRWNGKLLAEEFKLPDMEVEIERAVEQVERSIKSQAILKEKSDKVDGERKKEAEESAKKLADLEKETALQEEKVEALKKDLDEIRKSG